VFIALLVYRLVPGPARMITSSETKLLLFLW